MAQLSPELQAILKQVAAELASIKKARETGTVTVHCGRDDLYVEVTRKRKHEAVPIEQE